MSLSPPCLRGCAVVLLAAAVLGGCGRSPAPVVAAPSAEGTGAAAQAVAGIWATGAALSEPQAAALHQQIMDDASRNAQRQQSRRRYDTALFSAEENYRITVEGCGVLAPDQQQGCRNEANSDLDAARAQARALYPH
jgi:hypothetical protein